MKGIVKENFESLREVFTVSQELEVIGKIKGIMSDGEAFIVKTPEGVFDVVTTSLIEFCGEVPEMIINEENRDLLIEELEYLVKQGFREIGVVMYNAHTYFRNNFTKFVNAGISVKKSETMLLTKNGRISFYEARTPERMRGMNFDAGVIFNNVSEEAAYTLNLCVRVKPYKIVRINE